MNKVSFIFLGALLIVASAGGGHAASLVSEQLVAKLHAEQAVVAPGATASVVLHQKMAAGWHTYWQNPGDSGQSAAIDWVLPDGVKLVPAAWPAPKRIEYGPLVNYGYKDEAALLFDVTLPADWPAGRALSLRAETEILVCADLCIPVNGELAIEIPTGAKTVRDDKVAALFEKARARLPLPSRWPVTAGADKDGLAVRLNGPSSDFNGVDRAYLFPLTWGLVEHAAPQRLVIDAEGLTIRAPRGEAILPDEFAGVVTIYRNNGAARSFMLSGAPLETGKL